MISVIIVNWNTKDLLLACVRSLKEHTREQTLEIIVVDNASTDGSQEALKAQFPDIVLIQNRENLGFAKANNIGITRARGEYLCLVNSDVEIKDGCIDKMAAYLKEHPEIGLMGPKIYLPDGSVQRSCKQFPSIRAHFCSAVMLHRIFPGKRAFAGEEMTWFGYDTTQEVDVLTGAFWLTHRKAVNDVGLLDERFFFYSEDVDWCRRFKDRGWKTIFFPEARITHFTGGSSTDDPVKYYVRLCRAKLQYWEKHSSKINCFIVKLIMLIHQLVRIISESAVYILNPSGRKTASYKIKRGFSCAKWLITDSFIVL